MLLLMYAIEILIIGSNINVIKYLKDQLIKTFEIQGVKMNILGMTVVHDRKDDIIKLN